jgi:hypothetical protein
VFRIFIITIIFVKRIAIQEQANITERAVKEEA